MIWVSSIFSSVNWVSSPSRECLGRIKCVCVMEHECSDLQVMALRKYHHPYYWCKTSFPGKLNAKEWWGHHFPSTILWDSLCAVSQLRSRDHPCSPLSGFMQCALDYVPPFSGGCRWGWMVSDRSSSFNFLERQRQTWEAFLNKCNTYYAILPSIVTVYTGMTRVQCPVSLPPSHTPVCSLTWLTRPEIRLLCFSV